MTSTTLQRTTTLWRSERRPEVFSNDPALAEVIAWADAEPRAWHIVAGRRSKAFGAGSCTYIGWAQRGMAPEALLERLRHLHDLATGRDPHPGPPSIFPWRARFTLEHYGDIGFTGGLFRQHEDGFERLCLTLDYTPLLLQPVIDRFLAWCGRGGRTTRVTLDGCTVRRLGGA